MKCLEKCKEYEVSCPNKDCRLWIESSSEHNCSLEAIERSFDTEGRPLTLEEVGKRLKLSFVRIIFRIYRVKILFTCASL